MSREDAALNRSQRARLRHNPDAARALPAPEDTYRMFETPEVCHGAIRTFVIEGIVERVGTTDGTESGVCGIYRTPELVHEWIEDELRTQPTLPCGHGGFSNLGDGEYTCTEETCEARHDRATVAAVFDIGDPADSPDTDTAASIEDGETHPALDCASPGEGA